MASTQTKRARYAQRKAAAVTDPSAVCQECQIEKPAAEFRNNWHRPSGLDYRCHTCTSDWNRADKFELSAEQYRAMLETQNHLCAICNQPEKGLSKNGRIKALAVDHNHETGQVRGLLCANCNKGIGNLGDSPDTLISAAAYLMQYAAQGVI